MNLEERRNLELATREAIHDALLNSVAVRDRLLELDSKGALAAMDPESDEYRDRFLMLVEAII